MEKSPEVKLNIEELLQKNLEATQEILVRVKYIKRYVVWQKIFGWAKLLLIVIPLVVAIIYLPPLIKQLTSSYQGVVGELQKAQQLNNLDIKQFLQ